MKKVIEVCLDSVESIMAAEKGGADRVELCSDLFEGGLSPSIGMVRVAKRMTHIPINAMVRPRGGDFCYSDVEFEVMCAEVEAFRHSLRNPHSGGRCRHGAQPEDRGACQAACGDIPQGLRHDA